MPIDHMVQKEGNGKQKLIKNGRANCYNTFLHGELLGESRK